ncbi:zinc-binding dehydrogenase [Fodinicola acaciae]|uniref:zinc-binding dehydrogenase n=1 Tax=Fodinicola acaciae TaxID=2681555 RepID=UPI0013D8C376|nr:zinc-binding dehydrogenase [Fodinicola acaciae]
MHAIRQHEFGPAETLRYQEVPDVVPAAGQLRIAVRAAGVHLADTMIRKGQSGGPFAPPELPMTPGREVAGVVDQVGDGVDASWIGKRVVAHLGFTSGGYAELAVVSAASVHETPDGLTDEVAVASIGTGRTAAAILEIAAITGDDVVLVPAAAGGIGSLLVQAGRNAGAYVVGLAGPSKVDIVRKLGADAAVDYTADGWAEAVREALGGREVTLLLDGVGGEAGRAAWDLVGIGGRVVLFGWSSGDPLEVTTDALYERGLTVTVAVGPRVLKRPGGLRGLETIAIAEAAAGRLVPLVHQPYALADAAAAHRALENRETTGKVVLKP